MSWLQPESSLPEVGFLLGIAMGDGGPVAFGTKSHHPWAKTFLYK